MQKKILTLLFLSTLYFLLSTKIIALDLQSPLYHLQTEQTGIDLQQGTQQTTYLIKSTLGEKAYEDFQGRGYFVQTTNQEEPLRQSVSQSLINLGDIAKNVDLTGKTDLSVFSGTDQIYQLSLTEEYSLKNTAGDTLSNLKYNLPTSQNWLNIPNQNAGAPSAALLTNLGNVGGQDISINFKLNSPGSQSEGTYETILDFVLTPGY